MLNTHEVPTKRESLENIRNLICIDDCARKLANLAITGEHIPDVRKHLDTMLDNLGLDLGLDLDPNTMRRLVITIGARMATLFQLETFTPNWSPVLSSALPTKGHFPFKEALACFIEFVNFGEQDKERAKMILELDKKIFELINAK